MPISLSLGFFSFRISPINLFLDAPIRIGKSKFLNTSKFLKISRFWMRFKKAKKEIGFTADIDLEEGLKRLIDWRASHKSEVEARKRSVGLK